MRKRIKEWVLKIVRKEILDMQKDMKEQVREIITKTQELDKRIETLERLLNAVQVRVDTKVTKEISQAKKWLNSYPDETKSGGDK